MKKILINIALKLVELVNQTTSPDINGLYASLKLSALITPVILVWDKLSNWGVCNQDYILIVLGAILIDWIFGTIKHIGIIKDPSIKKNAVGLVSKLVLASAGGFLFEGLSYIVSESEIIFGATKMVTRIVVLMYPAMSAFENIYIVSGEKFPPKAWMEGLKKWEKSLNPNDLVNKNKNDINK